MGIYDRDYYQEKPPGFSLGGNRMMVTNIVLVNVIIFLVDVVFFGEREMVGGVVQRDGQISNLLSLNGDVFLRPWTLWKLVTYGFAHDPGSIWHVGFNMLILWFLGREVEGIYGKKQFLQLYLSTIVLCGLFWVVTENIMHMGAGGLGNYRLVGASGAVTAIALIFVIHYPRRTVYLYFLIPVPIWVVAVLYLAYDIVGTFERSGNVANSVHLCGAALGYLFYRTGWHLGRLVPQRLSLKGFQRRPQVRIHDPDADEEKLNVEVDRILQKISQEGEASLTRKERRTLEQASRRYQQKQR